ncbi:GNAT family N-acetyltransferase [Marinifilum caeruleilacunae]|uniref:N-acetyltransferase n=1 Tax=Marinifilum caeruleilacunae TaxID=2499076 RepID=A0ABX1WVC8_9BACT|nr:N-acetyltransferase [Marinifilum caeruleilacunae]NOU60073.1 N-acetyltransferase [Marinifilum caeruleilacunae]
MKVSIRPENKNDYPIISMINDMAFGQENEGLLIEKLRKNKSFIKELSLVACLGNEIVGHILFFPVNIKSKEKTFKTLALAPMSVIPELQGLGIGSQLVQKGLAKAKKLGHESVIVLGHEGFYPKFGFKTAGSYQISAPFDVPENSFMALELVKDSLSTVEGTIEYPKEFNEV